MKKPDKIIIFICFLALVVRVLLIHLPGFSFDITAWFAWALRLSSLGFGQFYSPTIWTNYTPGYLYVLYLFGLIKDTVGMSDNIFYLLLKFPAIVCDLILGVFIYYLSLSKLNSKKAILITSLFLFNPVIIFNSAVWGQIDSILTLGLVLSIYFLNQKKYRYFVILYAISLLIKPQAVALVPAIALFYLKNFSLKNLAASLISGLALIVTFSLPFFPNQPIFGIFNLIFQMIKDYAYTSLFAYNFWGIIGFWMDDTQRFFNLTYQQIGQLGLVIFWIATSIYYFKNKFSLYSLSLLALLSFYFIPTRVHERYLYPAFVFLLIVFIETKNKTWIYIYLLFSILHFLNLYYVYVYYNEIYNNSTRILYIQGIYDFLDKHPRLFSVSASLLFISSFWIIINTRNETSKS